MSSARAEPGGPSIRPVTAADHDAVWAIFHEVVAAGESYAFDPATPRDEALRLWRRLGFDTVGLLPGAFRHVRHGWVDALVMYRRL